MTDRRRPPPPTPLGYIDRLPARALLDRLPVPIWAVQDDTVIYANPAFADMLGRPAGRLTGADAAALLAYPESQSTAMVVRQHAGALLGVNHVDGSVLKVIVSEPLLVRTDDPITLVGVQDVTTQLWEANHS